MLTGLVPHQFEILPDFGICILHCQELAQEVVGTKKVITEKPTIKMKTNFERVFKLVVFIPKV
jgi:hypothetical protein